MLTVSQKWLCLGANDSSGFHKTSLLIKTRGRLAALCLPNLRYPPPCHEFNNFTLKQKDRLEVASPAKTVNTMDPFANQPSFMFVTNEDNSSFLAKEQSKANVLVAIMECVCYSRTQHLNEPKELRESIFQMLTATLPHESCLFHMVLSIFWVNVDILVTQGVNNLRNSSPQDMVMVPGLRCL